MGKIILTERQYRNLNQILIGKEIENNKGRLNEEMTEDERLAAESVGKQIQYTLKQCDGEESGQWCINKMAKLLVQLKSHDQFDEASKFTSYWVSGSYTKDQKWCTNLGAFLDNIEGLPSPGGDKIGGATAFASYFATAGGKLGFTKTTDSAGLIILKPNSFTLSWSAPASATAAPATVSGTETVNVIDSTKKATPLQAITAFQHYIWYEYETNESLVSGKEGDVCSAKYRSVLCGGNPCLKSQAVDGKKGTNTANLKDQIYANDAEKKKFEDWYLQNAKGQGEYGVNNDILLPAKKCSSSEKGYTTSVKTPSSTSRRSSTGGGGGGTGANELSGLV